MRAVGIAVFVSLASVAGAAELYPAVGGLELIKAPDKGESVLIGMDEATQDEALKVAVKVWGQPSDSGLMPECGAGPIEYTTFENGLTLHFQDGNFVGWTTQFQHGPSLRNGFGIGSTVADAAAFAGPAEIEETSIGPEFWGENFYGTATTAEMGGQVELFWSGVSCIFR